MFTKDELEMIFIALDNYCPPDEVMDEHYDELKTKIRKELSK